MAPDVVETPVGVMIVDDHPLVRAGLQALIASASGVDVVAEASSGEFAVAMAGEVAPDVVLMDLSMPGIGGVEATRQLVLAHPDIAVVVLTSFQDQPSVVEALRAGAVGYLLKDAEPAELVAAIRSAARGHSPLDPRVARVLLPLTEPAPAPAPAPAESPLTPSVPLSGREEQVLRLITRGMSNKQIGNELGIAERTVKVHVGHLFRRITVADRTSAAMWARDNLPW